MHYKIIEIIYNAQDDVTNFFDDYSTIESEANYKKNYGEGIKILISKQMLRRLPIVLTQVKASNTFENLLNEIRRIIYFLYYRKEITKKVYNNITNWTQLQHKKKYMFMN